MYSSGCPSEKGHREGQHRYDVLFPTQPEKKQQSDNILEVYKVLSAKERTDRK